MAEEIGLPPFILVGFPYTPPYCVHFAMALFAAKFWGKLRRGGGQDLNRILKSVYCLAEAHEKLLVFSEPGQLDTKSEAGANGVAMFLEILSRVCSRCLIEVTDRSYRKA